MNIEKIIELVEEWIDDMDTGRVGSETATEEEKERIIENAKDIARLHISKAKIEEWVEIYNYDDEESLAADYAEKICDDAYLEAIMGC